MKELKLPRGSLICLVRRTKPDGSDEIFIPTGNASLMANDRAIVFATLAVIEKTLEALGVSSL